MPGAFGVNHGFEVLIQLTAADLCHSDLHIKKGFMDLGTQGKLRFSDRGLKLRETWDVRDGQESVKKYIQVKLV